MRLLCDLSGRELAALLWRHYAYDIVGQTGSHLRLTTTVSGEHRVTLLAGGPLQVGTLAAILGEVASHHGITRSELEERLFG